MNYDYTPRFIPSQMFKAGRFRAVTGTVAYPESLSR